MSTGRVIEITGESQVGFQDAIEQAIGRAAITVRRLQSAWVKEQRVSIVDGAISSYQVNLLLTFVLFSQFVAAIALIKPQASLSHAPLAIERANLIARLTAAGGKHLVIVTYGPHHEPLFDFVFNAADIDSAAVVFARSMGPGNDHMLLDYFHDRKAWDLYYDDTGDYRVSPR